MSEPKISEESGIRLRELCREWITDSADFAKVFRASASYIALHEHIAALESEVARLRAAQGWMPGPADPSEIEWIQPPKSEPRAAESAKE